mgnify:CR=1 FL=1
MPVVSAGATQIPERYGGELGLGPSGGDVQGGFVKNKHFHEKSSKKKPFLKRKTAVAASKQKNKH